MAKRKKNTLEDRHYNAAVRLEIAQMKQAAKMLESLPVFAQDIDEKDWTTLSRFTKAPYSEQTLNEMRISADRLQYTPAGKGILQTLRDFIIGKKASIDPVSPSDEVAEYWEKWQKDNNFDNRSKEFIRRLFRDGEVFVRWFPPNGIGGHIQMRFINPGEIVTPNTSDPDWTFGIHTDPDDVETVIEYHRKWKSGNVEKTEFIQADEIDHIKLSVDANIKRGVSFFVGIGKWMTQYELWLRDRYMLNRVRQIWNVVGKVQPGTAISTIKDKFTDVTRDAPVGGVKNKKQLKPGSVLLQKGVEWDLKNLNIRAQDTKDDGRLFQLMIGLGTGFPEYIIRADASNSNMASTMISESPFVRAMESHQDFIEEPFKAIYARVIQHGLDSGDIPASAKEDVKEYDEKTGNEKVVVKDVPTSTDCTINFATLIHRDLEKDTKSYMIHDEQGYASKQTIREKLGYDNEFEVEQIRKEKEQAVKDAKEFDTQQEKDLKDQRFDKDDDEDEDD
jgi:hypothetical protein